MKRKARFKFCVRIEVWVEGTYDSDGVSEFIVGPLGLLIWRVG